MAAGWLLVAVCLTASCQDQAASTQSAPQAAGTGQPAKGVAAAYVCPMRCEGSASAKPGKCLVCEMDLEPNPNYRSAQ